MQVTYLLNFIVMAVVKCCANDNKDIHKSGGVVNIGVRLMLIYAQ